MHLTIGELLDYTDEERAKWRRWFGERGGAPLKTPLAGETHTSVGALILHVFWAEMYYVRWMRGETLTEDSEVVTENKDLPSDDVDRLFDFGLRARREMRAFADAAGREEWEKIYEVESGGFNLRGTARKLVVHILVHEVRHWAQAAVVVRQDGLAPPGDHDLCFSESFGPLLKRVGGGGEE
jgi:uncharacterized damage-inducible protein DinB